MATVNEKMTVIANEVRELTGATEKLGLDAIASNLIIANNAIIEQATTIEEISGLVGGDKIIIENQNILNNTASLIDLKNYMDDYIVRFDICNLTFPENGLGAYIYFTDENGGLQTKIVSTTTPFTIKVVKDSIVYSNNPIFADDTFIISDSRLATKLGGSNSQAIAVHENLILEYADNAPN